MDGVVLPPSVCLSDGTAQRQLDAPGRSEVPVRPVRQGLQVPGEPEAPPEARMRQGAQAQVPDLQQDVLSEIRAHESLHDQASRLNDILLHTARQGPLEMRDDFLDYLR